MTDDELLDAARRLFHRPAKSEGSAAVTGVPASQLVRVIEMAEEMRLRRVAFLDQTDAIIAEHGFMVQGVFGDATGPSFAYTTGLHPKHDAECLVRGFGQSTPSLVYAAVRWLDDGLIRLTPGVYQIPDGGRIRVEPWRGPVADFGMANRWHSEQGRADYPRVQVLFADDEDRLPGEPGCTVTEHQLRGLP